MAEVTIEAIGGLLDKKLDEKLKDVVTVAVLDERLKNVVTTEILDERLLEFPTREDYRVLSAKVDDIREKVNRIDKRTDEDTRAVIKDVERLKKRYA